MKYKNTITQITVGLKTENPVHGDVLRIRVEDEGGGPFLVISQYSDENGKEEEVRFEIAEWSNVYQAVSTLINQPLV